MDRRGNHFYILSILAVAFSSAAWASPCSDALEGAQARLNTDRFAITAVSQGAHGGQLYEVTTSLGWDDPRQDPSPEGADLTQDLRMYPWIMGSREAAFFGFAQYADRRVQVPDWREVQGAIDRFNRGLDLTDPRRIAIGVYDADERFTQSEPYLKNFLEQGAIPVSHKDRQFFHDISSHALEGFFLDNRILNTFVARVKLWQRFIAWLVAQPGLTREDVQRVIKVKYRNIDLFARQVDRLTMGIGEFIPTGLDLRLRQVGAALTAEGKGYLPSRLARWVGRLPGVLFRATALNGYSLSQFPLLSDDYLQGLSEGFSRNPRLMQAWQQFLVEDGFKDPALAWPLPISFGDALSQLHQTKKIRDPVQREAALARTELGKAYAARLKRLREIISTSTPR